MTPEAQSRAKVGTITEKVSTRTIDALISIYRDQQQAFLELIDNAVDNREPGKSLLVRIRVSKNELTVFNQGGRGLDFEGLENFFVWGYSEKTVGKIGFYGVGGKAAMGFLGRSMEVVCSEDGSDTEYRVYDPAWEIREEGEWKQFEPTTKQAATRDGYFRAKITNLKREVNAQALANKLADIYRPLLLDGSLTISVNGKQIEPLEINYLDSDPNFQPQLLRIQTRFGDWIEIKAGVLADSQKVKPGIRCYYRGRLIQDEEFFGLPSPAQMPQMSRFIGEAHLDFVPVTTNKTDFIRSSVQYEAAVKRTTDALKTWVDKMAKLKLEQKVHVDSFEKDLAKKAKRVLEHVFATTGLVVKRDLAGEAEGRRPPTRRDIVVPPTPPGGKRGGTGPKEGQTAPVLAATIGEIKRWGAMFKWDIVSMGSQFSRSEVVEENGRQVLKINADYPFYQAEKKAGAAALELYLAETAILKIAEVVTKGKSIEDYVELVNNLSRDCGMVYRSRIRDQATVKGKRRK